MESALYLIDVSALAYRSHFAFIRQPLINSQGREVSALFGFVSHTLRLIQERRPSHLAFVKDLKGPTLRHEMFADYKAHRPPMPDALAAQLPEIDAFVEDSGLKLVSLQGYEADDVMATLAKQGKAQGLKVFLATRDKDLMQLVGDGIYLFELGKRDTDHLEIGPAEVEEKFGLPPERIGDYLALVGDSADNVPGVAGIGPKGAVELLKTYGTLDGVLSNIPNISKKGLRQKLEAGRDNAVLSRRLVELHCDLTLPLSVDALAYTGMDAAAVRSFLDRHELKSLQKFVPSAGGGADDAGGSDAGRGEAEGEASGAASGEAEPAGDYRLVNDVATLAAMAEDLRGKPFLAVDTETTGLDSRKAGLVGLCLCADPGIAYYVAVGHAEGPNVPLADLRAALLPLLDAPDAVWVLHNAKYDLPILDRHGLLPPGGLDAGKVRDTMVAAFLCYPGERALSLDDLALRHFDHAMIPIEGLIGKKGKEQRTFAEVPQDEACRYGAEDADFTRRLWDVVAREMEAKGQSRVFVGLEMALLPVLLRMEAKGIRLNAEAFASMAETLRSETARLEKAIHDSVGHAFNVASPVQLQQVLFTELGLKPGKKTKTGYSTDAEVLERLEGEHPVVSLLLDHRESTKLLNTYVESLPALVDPESGRLHTTYSQVVAATGRLSSLNPNLQNIPIRTEAGQRIRAGFVAPPGRVLLAADYSQIELRLLAHLSGDPALVAAYRDGVDIHARTAAALYKVPEEKVTADMRRSAKVVNFGVLYGMGSLRLSQQLKIPRDEAKRFIGNYFDSFARVRGYIEATVEAARRTGYVETLSGRRRFLPDLHTDNRPLRENAERIAVNTPIQGSAADLIKLAMIGIDRRIRAGDARCDMLLQVHDELVFECDAGDAEAVGDIVRGEMEGAMSLSVPLRVELGWAGNWLEAKA